MVVNTLGTELEVFYMFVQADSCHEDWTVFLGQPNFCSSGRGYQIRMDLPGQSKGMSNAAGRADR